MLKTSYLTFISENNLIYISDLDQSDAALNAYYHPKGDLTKEHYKNTKYIFLHTIDLSLSLSLTNFSWNFETVWHECPSLQEIYPPKIGEFAYVTDGACDSWDIRRTELHILKVASHILNYIQQTLLKFKKKNKKTHATTHTHTQWYFFFYSCRH